MKEYSPKRYWTSARRAYAKAINLEHGVFARKHPRKVAQLLKDSAIKSNNWGMELFHSAVSFVKSRVLEVESKFSAVKLSVVHRANSELKTRLHL
jgi:hypothetical protein